MRAGHRRHRVPFLELCVLADLHDFGSILPGIHPNSWATSKIAAREKRLLLKLTEKLVEDKLSTSCKTLLAKFKALCALQSSASGEALTPFLRCILARGFHIRLQLLPFQATSIEAANERRVAEGHSALCGRMSPGAHPKRLRKDLRQPVFGNSLSRVF